MPDKPQQLNAPSPSRIDNQAALSVPDVCLRMLDERLRVSQSPEPERDREAVTDQRDDRPVGFKVHGRGRRSRRGRR
jgi:hypothetical protein